MIAGACLCGALRYEVEGPLLNPTHCHCSMCRKHHGAPFATFVESATGAFRWLGGADSLSEYASSARCTRRFCKVCGSIAPTERGERVWIPVGNLHGDFELPPALHRFVASKAPWYVIADSLPQYLAEVPGSAAAETQTDRTSRLAGATGGSCLCGEVTFTVTGRPMRWLQCHCSRCRRGRSAAHGSNTFYPEAQFAWGSGSERVRLFKPADAQRFMVGFCVRCGGGTPVKRESAPFVLIPAGLFDGDPGTRPEAHIHVASKAPWYPITDSLPQFAELPPTG